MSATVSRPAIGDSLPADNFYTLRPVVRIESWGAGGLWLPLEPYRGDEEEGRYLADVDDNGQPGEFRIYPEWSAAPEYWLPHDRHGIRRPVCVVATGRRPVRYSGEYWLRARVEFCNDGAPSTHAPGWLLLD